MMFQHFMQNPTSADAKVYFTLMGQQYTKQLQRNLAVGNEEALLVPPTEESIVPPSVECDNAATSPNAEDSVVPLIECNNSSRSPDDGMDNLDANYYDDDDSPDYVLPPTQKLIARLEQNGVEGEGEEDTQLTTLDY